MRLSSSIRGRYASIRVSGPAAVDVGSVVAPGANCRHSAGANCQTIYLIQSLEAKKHTCEIVSYSHNSHCSLIDNSDYSYMYTNKLTQLIFVNPIHKTVFFFKNIVKKLFITDVFHNLT